MFVDLDLIVSYLANIISAFQYMFNCAATQASSCPLLYNCIMTLFNFVTSKKTKDWFKDHAGKMPLFPKYIALLSDKLFVGFVKSEENYTSNQCTVKDGLVINLDMDDLSRAIGTFYNVQAAGAALDTAMATPAVVVATAQVVVVVSTPGVPVPVLVRAASETPPARVFATTKDVTSSSGACAIPLGPSALRLESYIAPNTPPKVIVAAIQTVL
jgi:hypothetical protein